MTEQDKVTARNYRRTIQEFMLHRKGWLDILVKNPRNSEAARHIISINDKIELLDIMRHQLGDYEWIDDV